MLKGLGFWFKGLGWGLCAGFSVVLGWGSSHMTQGVKHRGITMQIDIVPAINLKPHVRRSVLPSTLDGQQSSTNTTVYWIAGHLLTKVLDKSLYSEPVTSVEYPIQSLHNIVQLY